MAQPYIRDKQYPTQDQANRREEGLAILVLAGVLMIAGAWWLRDYIFKDAAFRDGALAREESDRRMKAESDASWQAYYESKGRQVVDQAEKAKAAHEANKVIAGWGR
jgi:hypothetical protein